MGVVFQARDEGGREVALKLMTGALEEGRRERFRREGELAARLRHPGIVQVHAAGEHEGRPWLAYELVRSSRTLEDAFAQLPWIERVELVGQACEAVAAAHAEGVVHRDLKPDNLLLDQAGGVRVADFGLATAADLERLTRTGAIVGTPLFLPPEAFSGEKVREPTFDVWSLGVLLYLALTGRYPYEATSLLELGARLQRPPVPPTQHVPELPPRLEGVVLRALEPDLRRRTADAGALAVELRQSLASPTAPARSRTSQWLALACLLALGALPFLLARPAQSDQQTPPSTPPRAASARPSLAASAPPPTAAPVRVRSTAQRVLAQALAVARRAHGLVLANCRKGLAPDDPHRELLLAEQPLAPRDLPVLLDRWAALYVAGALAARSEHALLCDRLARAGCLEPLGNLAQRVWTNPAIQESQDASLRADAKLFATTVLKACVLRGSRRAARTLGGLGDQEAARLAARSRERKLNLADWAELLSAWRRASVPAWRSARAALPRSEHAAFLRYLDAWEAVPAPRREDLLVEFSLALEEAARLREAAGRGLVDPALLAWGLERIECPRLLHLRARREVASEAGAPRAEQLAALERGLATVEQGLALQPDECRLLILRSQVLEKRASWTGSRQDLEQALESLVRARTILNGAPSPSEARLRAALAR